MSATDSDQYEIRIVCDMKAHPHHKGRPQHITKVAWSPLGNFREPGGWVTAFSELRKQYDPDGSAKPRVRFPHSVQEEPIPGQASGESRTYNRKRYELECPRCKYRVEARRETIARVLDLWRELGKTELSLQDLHKGLDAQAVARHARVARQG